MHTYAAVQQNCYRPPVYLQSLLNAAARLVCNSRKYDHISLLLSDLHWLGVPTESSFAWPSSCSGVAATPRRHIYPEICTGRRTATLGDDFVRHHLTSWWCLEHLRHRSSSYLERPSANHHQRVIHLCLQETLKILSV